MMLTCARLGKGVGGAAPFRNGCRAPRVLIHYMRGRGAGPALAVRMDYTLRRFSDVPASRTVKVGSLRMQRICILYVAELLPRAFRVPIYAIVLLC